MMPQRVLLAENELDVQNLMRSALARDGIEVVAVSTGSEAKKKLETEEFGLAILDWMMPDITGIELCKQFHDQIPILMVTARDESVDIVRGLDAGADDYLTKPFEVAILTARARALLRRGKWLKRSEPASKISVGSLAIDLDAAKVTCGIMEVQVSSAELKLLTMLVENQGKVMSRSKLVSLTHGESVHVIDRVIDTQVYNLRKKLGVCGKLFETVRGVGYRVRNT